MTTLLGPKEAVDRVVLLRVLSGLISGGSLNARVDFRKHRGSFFPPGLVGAVDECGSRIVFPLGGTPGQEYLPCLCPTIVPGGSRSWAAHIRFTARQRRKNEEIETHSLHTWCPPDADL